MGVLREEGNPDRATPKDWAFRWVCLPVIGRLLILNMIWNGPGIEIDVFVGCDFLVGVLVFKGLN